MKIIVDTNIVFSAILNSTSKIARILLNSTEHIQFYTCEYLQTEIFTHRKKLLKLTKLSEPDLTELTELVTHRITFINESLLPGQLLQETESLLRDIDPNDTPFVALAKHLNGTLWTGDMQLYRGLTMSNFKDVVTTAQLSLLLEEGI